MWIQVRTIDGSQTRTIEDVSRKATIEELRERVWALFDVRPECQRLFYRGKQVRRAHRTPLEAGARAAGRHGVAWAGRAGGLGARRTQSAPSSTSGGQPSRLRVRPCARLRGLAGSWPAPLQVRSAGAPRAPRPHRPYQAGQQPQAQPARAPGFPRFPRLVGPGPLQGGEGSGLWRPCRSAGGEGRRPPLPAALTRLTARIASVSLPGSRLPNRRGNIHCSLWGSRPEVCLLTVEGIYIY